MKVSELLYNCVGAEGVFFVNDADDLDVVGMPLDEYVDILSEDLLDATVCKWWVDYNDIGIRYKYAEE